MRRKFSKKFHLKGNSRTPVGLALLRRLGYTKNCNVDRFVTHEQNGRACLHIKLYYHLLPLRKITIHEIIVATSTAIHELRDFDVRWRQQTNPSSATKPFLVYFKRCDEY